MQMSNSGNTCAVIPVSYAILKKSGWVKLLKFDNDTIDKVKKLVRYHDRKIETNAKSVRRAVSDMGEDIFPLLFSVKYADIIYSF